jgi:hypothetical protein
MDPEKKPFLGRTSIEENGKNIFFGSNRINSSSAPHRWLQRQKTLRRSKMILNP